MKYAFGGADTLNEKLMMRWMFLPVMVLALW